MAADRRIDPARRARHVGQQRLVQHLAHAVQALEFVALRRRPASSITLATVSALWVANCG